MGSEIVGSTSSCTSAPKNTSQTHFKIHFMYILWGWPIYDRKGKINVQKRHNDEIHPQDAPSRGWRGWRSPKAEMRCFYGSVSYDQVEKSMVILAREMRDIQ